MVWRIVVLVVVLAASVLLGLWWQRRQGVVRAARHAHEDGAVDWAALGIVLGEHRTLVQFSSEFCSPCRHTARVLDEVVAARTDVTHREMDVDEHHDLVRTFGILRTPTVLVLDPSGREVARMSGSVNRAQAVEALDVPAGSVA
ncbi:thioredoxin [Oerskovia turbata]|uniref:Thioredoxin n=2 Tax=Oerskovia turbata TaxID=1713 RepID=A0A4Q1L2T9_9CELL|nr:thioredoxin family protein [Oerskovia turbata]RXR27188.1 thioredoxin [Oerskovia turbata]RXR36455.1 thioredoxin [Oerskovia turbata]TGJ95796.1 thioredoxin [Actinotalea fermentans ATCC 43279 = JCM 9966 = DSM 3133]